MANWNEWTKNDIIFGIIVPIIVALLILVFPLYIGPALHDFDPTLESILVYGLEEAIMIVAVPMFLGLLWNQWAGGSAGFLLGSIYALRINSDYVLYGYPADISMLGYVISGMLIGYMSGALNHGSYSFRRMLISGLISSIIGGVILFLIYSISPLQMTTGAYGFFITLLPRIIYGVLIPIIATVFTWYGFIARRMS